MGFRFQVSGFRFQVSGLGSQVLKEIDISDVFLDFWEFWGGFGAEERDLCRVGGLWTGVPNADDSDGVETDVRGADVYRYADRRTERWKDGKM